MGYNITHAEIFSGGVFITGEQLVAVLDKLRLERGGWLPEYAEDARSDPAAYAKKGRLKCIPWMGEGANSNDGLFRILEATTGSGTVLIIWEGGDRIDAHVVVDGRIEPGELVIRTAEGLDA